MRCARDPTLPAAVKTEDSDGVDFEKSLMEVGSSNTKVFDDTNRGEFVGRSSP